MTHTTHIIDLHGNVATSFDLKAGATGTLDTGAFPLYQSTFDLLFIRQCSHGITAGLPGFNFNG
jgi:hypothetical protein